MAQEKYWNPDALMLSESGTNKGVGRPTAYNMVRSNARLVDALASDMHDLCRPQGGENSTERSYNENRCEHETISSFMLTMFK